LDGVSTYGTVTTKASTTISGVVDVHTDALVRLDSDIDNLQEKMLNAQDKITDIITVAGETAITNTAASFSSAVVEGPYNVLNITGLTRKNLIVSSNMDSDSNADGVVNNFIKYWEDGITAVYSYDNSERAQKIEMTDSTIIGNAYIYQTIDNINPGDVLS
jgi:hypothetical protein